MFLTAEEWKAIKAESTKRERVAEKDAAKRLGYNISQWLKFWSEQRVANIGSRRKMPDFSKATVLIMANS